MGKGSHKSNTQKKGVIKELMFKDLEDFKENANTHVADTDEDAKKRYERWKSEDPFPEIPPALLNTADIYAYVQKTGMIYPFDAVKLKSATYPIKIGERVLYWDDDGIQHSTPLEDEESTFTLKQNSVIFVELEPTFRVPNYLAFRFNLKIKHIYKGLLLGTGPIVDPGFQGKLYIPLHNLTNNIYEFSKKETLIFMEFTKLSPHKSWANQCCDLKIPYVSFSPDKFERDFFTYVQDALKNSIVDSNGERIHTVSVKNAVPTKLMDFEQTLKIYTKKVDNIKLWAIGTVIALAVSTISVIVGVYTLIETSNSRFDALVYQVKDSEILEDKISELEEFILEQQEKNQEQEQLIIEMQEKLEEKLDEPQKEALESEQTD